MKLYLRTILALFIGTLAGALVFAVMPSNAVSSKHDHHAQHKTQALPSTVPAGAKTQVATLDTETGAVANEYISFYKDYLTGEYTAYVSVFDPDAQYGWSPCPVNQCGTIKIVNDRIVVRTKDTEQRISAYYSYLGKAYPNVNNYNWDGMSMPLSSVMSWRGKRYTEYFDYAGAAVYNPAFPVPTYDPCPECGGK